MSVRILIGDVREQLKALPDESVQCVVTSPPYWGLRDYGVDGQIGLEASPDLFVAEIVGVFREVRRVLRSDGTLWLNMGDSYATGAGKVGDHPGGGEQGARWMSAPTGAGHRGRHEAKTSGKHAPRIAAMGPVTQPNRMPQEGLKPKDLVGIPWRVAFALQADGWWLRQDIIWSKPNPMPESVTDRCTKAHEYMFLLSKSERYHFDASAIAEPAGYDPAKTKFPDGWDTGEGGHGAFHRLGREKGRKSGNKERKPASARGVPVDTDGKSAGAVAGSVPWEGVTRNKRSVWVIGTEAFPEAHFATFPTELVKPCILAGCPKGGTVLDPFGGSGTTGMVADRMGRDAILIELNPAYAEIARKRITGDAPMFADVQTSQEAA